jgi:methionine-gamma-lyase
LGSHKPRHLATEAIHAGELHDASGAHIAPIYQTSTFTFRDMDAVESWAAGDADSYIYSRGGNPARRALAAKLAALEGFDLGRDQPVAAEIFASGMAAITAALLGSAQAGGHIITQQVLYGSADHLITDVLPGYGVTHTRIPGLRAEELREALARHSNTAAVYMETPANPTLEVIDIAQTAAIAHDHGARLVVDNTFATPVLQRPLSLGADIVVHSTTKYINGHGTIIGGALLSTDIAWMEERVAPLIRFTGSVPSPFDCWLTNLGLKTLPLRMARHCSSAMEVAEFLDSHGAIGAVHYPGLPHHPQHEVARHQMSDFGAMLAFDLGSYAAATRLLDRVQLCTLAVSLGNLDTLIEHPASMTHRMVPPEQRAAAGISDGLIRLSVGLEDPADLLTDLERALAG